MTPNEYLQKVLDAQTLNPDSDEVAAIQDHRADVEELLRQHFEESSPVIRYAGSKAKGTMIRESYDLDVICYFKHEDTGAGASLEDIYNNTRDALAASYYVEPKQSALRLRGLEGEHPDFHIDVVPGRFIDDTQGDVYIYQSGAEKCRLKTNIDVHVAHVRDSGVREAIKLIKLWKVKNGIRLKNFVLELSVIKLLSRKKGSSLQTQLEHVWTELRDNIESLTVVDPANPDGNDLSAVLNASKFELKAHATSTLATIVTSGWPAVFGAVDEDTESQKSASLRRIVAAAAVPSRPWSD